MMKRTLHLTFLLGLMALAPLAAQAQVPSIAADGIRNGGSYTVAGLPN